MSRVESSQLPLRSWRLRILIVAGLVVLFGSIAIPAAQAATYTYVNNLQTDEGVSRQSNLRANLNGGGSSTGTYATSHIISFNPAPGYVEHGHASSSGSVTMTHANRTNAYSKCYWYFTGGGRTAMSCNATS